MEPHEVLNARLPSENATLNMDTCRAPVIFTEGQGYCVLRVNQRMGGVGGGVCVLFFFIFYFFRL